MSAMSAMVGGLSVDIPVGTVRRALAIAELSGSDTVSITISLEWQVCLTQTVACLVRQQLDEAVGQEKMSSDLEPDDGFGNQGAAASAALPVEDEQGPLVGGPEVGDIYSVGTDVCIRMRTSDHWTKKLTNGWLQMFRRPGELLRVHRRRRWFGKRMLRRTFL